MQRYGEISRIAKIYTCSYSTIFDGSFMTLKFRAPYQGPKKPMLCEPTMGVKVWTPGQGSSSQLHDS